MTLHAAWKMDTEGVLAARQDIAMIKYYGAKVLHDVVDRALQAHGSLGYSTDLPLEAMYRFARAARIYDGPDEVHRASVARQVLRRYEAPPDERAVRARADASRGGPARSSPTCSRPHRQRLMSAGCGPSRDPPDPRGRDRRRAPSMQFRRSGARRAARAASAAGKKFGAQGHLCRDEPRPIGRRRQDRRDPGAWHVLGDARRPRRARGGDCRRRRPGSR